MVVYDEQEKLDEILSRVQAQVDRRTPAARSPHILERELRSRRKSYLGSHISLRSLLAADGVVDDVSVDVLANHLTQLTLQFWRYKDEAAEVFCYRFYRLSIFVLMCDEIRECVDDIIQICGALVRSKEVFRIAVKDLVQPERYPELFRFLEDSEEAFLSPHFEDSVLYAIASFLGALSGVRNNAQYTESEDRDDG